jgi:hypothetical protein
MFRQPITTDPKKARRAFMLLVPPALVTVPLAVWTIILRDWLLLAIWAVGEANLVAMVKNYYTVGWPGSRLDSHRALPRLRFSQAQGLLAGLVFIVGTLGAQLVLGPGRKELVLVLGGLLSAVWLFRFPRAMRREGWRGKKDGAPPARL